MRLSIATASPCLPVLRTSHCRASAWVGGNHCVQLPPQSQRISPLIVRPDVWGVVHTSDQECRRLGGLPRSFGLAEVCKPAAIRARKTRHADVPDVHQHATILVDFFDLLRRHCGCHEIFSVERLTLGYKQQVPIVVHCNLLHRANPTRCILLGK